MLDRQAAPRTDKTLVLFGYDWDAVEFRRLAERWPQAHAGFNLHQFPSNSRLAWFDMERFVDLAVLKARLLGARAVVSNHEQFGALTAALLAERMGWPGTPVEAVLTCQHKLYAREVLDRVAPEANIPSRRLDTRYGEAIPAGIDYPVYAKPIKASFSVLARHVYNQAELTELTRFGPWELWVIRHLVEPFEKIVRKRLPAAGTAHSLILESPQRGRQYCLDGYVFEGDYRCLGVVDSIMYPGTDAFMRFDYPSRLPKNVQAQANDVASRFLKEIGFTHGLFNMEFIHDEHSGQIKVIEFNPRMASQFSDLYARVDGIDPHEIALAMAHGLDPQTLPTRNQTEGCASSFVYRSFEPSANVAMPSSAQLGMLKTQFPNSQLLQFPKLSGEIQRDFKWLGSYRYGILHLGGADPDDLRHRCEQASALLGWPAPYVADSTGLPGFADDAIWADDIETEKATG